MIDPTFISRLQFAFTITFHILYPAFSIGLVSFIAIMEACWLKTHDIVYYNICRFFTKLFALTFGMGVVSGIVMEFQIGTNWSGMSLVAGDILGTLFTYEVMTAFFVEAGFLGVLLFGWNRVSPKLHFTATCLVTFGVILSALWILTANTWMQHPIGYHMFENKLVADNWYQILFNPMLIPRFLHMILSSYIATACAIAAIGAYYILTNQHPKISKKIFKFALVAMMILTPTQVLIGDWVGLKVHEYQPIKSAAIEGVWETSGSVPYLIFAIPDQKAQKNHYEIKVPYAASFINTHTFDGVLTGLKSVSPEKQPPVSAVFFSFRIMLYAGFLMLFVSMVSGYYYYKGTIMKQKWLQRIWLLMAPMGFIAMETGWITAESGRQPWIIYNVIKTSEAASNIDIYQVTASFIMLFIVYVIIFGFFYFKYLFETIKLGPKKFNDDEIVLPFGYMKTNERKHIQ